MDRDDCADGRVVPRRPVGRRRRLDCRFQVRVSDGPEGKELARRQAAVIRDLLIWVAEQRQAVDAEPDAAHTAAPPPERDA
jgi:hypothetical protein